MFAKIFCPIDFSASSQQAMRVAVRIARDADADLQLLHFWHLPTFVYAIDAPYPAGTIEAMRADELKALAEAVAEAGSLGAKRVTSQFDTGLAADRICALAEADPSCDLIVMGTHGRTGIQRILLGSVTEKVIRHAPCSVLAVRKRDSADDTYRHILVPVDFSPSSRQAMFLAAELVRPGGRGITLLHVVELPIAYSGEPRIPGFTEDLDQRAAALLETWAKELRARVNVPVLTRTRLGRAGAQTLSLLDQDPSFDLVVVGSHGRTGLARLVPGSVAEKIVRHAPCPVLVARTRI